MKQKQRFISVLILCLMLASCAKKIAPYDVLLSLNLARDAYNLAYNAGACKHERTISACIVFHDAVDAGYGALRVWNATKTDSDLSALLLALEEIEKARQAFAASVGVEQ